MSKAKKDKEVSLYGFQINDEVLINNHFFSNHGTKSTVTDHGTIQGAKIEEGKTPKLLVRFPVSSEFFKNDRLHSMLETTQSKDTGFVLISIYPGYLDKAPARKKDDSKTGQTFRCKADRPDSKRQVRRQPPKFSSTF